MKKRYNIITNDDAAASNSKFKIKKKIKIMNNFTYLRMLAFDIMNNSDEFNTNDDKKRYYKKEIDHFIFMRDPNETCAYLLIIDKNTCEPIFRYTTGFTYFTDNCAEFIDRTNFKYFAWLKEASDKQPDNDLIKEYTDMAFYTVFDTDNLTDAQYYSEFKDINDPWHDLFIQNKSEVLIDNVKHNWSIKH